MMLDVLGVLGEEPAQLILMMLVALQGFLGRDSPAHSDGFDLFNVVGTQSIDASQSLKGAIMIFCGTDVDMWTFILRKTYVQDGMGCDLPGYAYALGSSGPFCRSCGVATPLDLFRMASANLAVNLDLKFPTLSLKWTLNRLNPK